MVQFAAEQRPVTTTAAMAGRSLAGDGFASALYGKLDMFRETHGFMSSTMNPYAAYAKAPYFKAPLPASVNPWLVYMRRPRP